MLKTNGKQKKDRDNQGSSPQGKTLGKEVILISVIELFSRFVRRFYFRAEHTGTRHLFGGRDKIPSTERHESFPGTIPFETFGISISKKCEKKFAQIHVIEIQNVSNGIGRKPGFDFPYMMFADNPGNAESFTGKKITPSFSYFSTLFNIMTIIIPNKDAKR